MCMNAVWFILQERAMNGFALANRRRLVILFSSCLFLIAAACLADDCEAQRKRGLFRGTKTPSTARQQTLASRTGESGITAEFGDTVDSAPRPVIHDVEDPVVRCAPVAVPYNWRRDPNCGNNPCYPNYPKYIGGFHSSHFHNLGLPTGDFGFRGNGLYWNPW